MRNIGELRPGHGWIEVICGGMFSGKSEELIRRVRRASIGRQRIQTFKHQLDKRYDEVMINSHAGGKIEAHSVADSDDLYRMVKGATRVVAIDEIQFFDEWVVDVCRELADSGKRVIVSGLDLDFRGEPFGFMPRLLAIAEFVDKLQAICVMCGAPATRTQRLIDGAPAAWDDPIILVGAAEAYEPRCRHCHAIEAPMRISAHPSTSSGRAEIQRTVL